MKIKTYFFLFVIIVLFLTTRMAKITEIPPSLYWDEASIGYNAHAVLLTGRDEWGEKYPLHFRAFGEFKLPVYIYSVAVAEKVGGYGELAVRLPAVIYSLVALILVFLITKYLAGNNLPALFSAFVFAVSPWGLLITRTGYEVTAGTAFFLAAFYFYLLSLTKPKYFFFSILMHIGAVYSYNSFRFISPLFIVLSLPLVFRRKSLPVTLISLFLLLVSFLPIYRLYRYDAGGLRLQAVALQGDSKDKFVHFIDNYLSHFSPHFLFTYGDINPRSNFPGFGLISPILIFSILLGVHRMFRKDVSRVVRCLLLVVLLLSPIPAALTRESPHALRSFLMFPILAILSGLGMKNKTLLLISLVFSILLFENYTYNFYSDYNRKYASDWQYEYKQIFGQKLNKNTVVSDRYGQPYIFALYYQKVDPDLFRGTVVYNPVSDWGFSTVAGFDDYRFIK